MADEFDADSGFVWSTRSGRNYNSLRPQRFNFGEADLVVTAHLNFGAQFSDVLDEVVGKRIVVIENEDHKFIVAAMESNSPPRRRDRDGNSQWEELFSGFGASVVSLSLVPANP